MLHPIANRLFGRLELAGQRLRAATGPDQLDHLLPVLQMVLGSHRGLLPPQRERVHETGSTPGDLNRLGADELGFETRLPVLEEHRDDFLEVALKLVQAVALRMCAGPPRHLTDVDAGFGILMND